MMAVFILSRQTFGREAIVTGFYHQGYEKPLLMLMLKRGVDAGLIVKGEEGALSLTTKSPSPDATIRGHPLNFCAGFRPPKLHLQRCCTKTLMRQLENNIEHGLTALRGVIGAAYDRIVFNTAMVEPATHLPRSREREKRLIAAKLSKLLMRYVSSSSLILAAAPAPASAPCASRTSGFGAAGARFFAAKAVALQLQGHSN
ncbi:hypothetical protein SELMODRAFT_416107 [Selaginella moellendorffii]|uniref:Uncharacterized protein n=1 Tax=Selaginella moellendorffii TaxID=88036 RepID=D8RY38_SELML|nr:hypothetical protein SELMODRAFT_416107 [Selaginella moellendorffii]